jgi:hypothetical protein
MIAMRRNRPKGNRVYEPTPKDIRQACEQIQAGWSKRERAKRAGQPRSERWTPPNIRLSLVLESVNEERADLPPYLRGLSGDLEP